MRWEEEPSPCCSCCGWCVLVVSSGAAASSGLVAVHVHVLAHSPIYYILAVFRCVVAMCGAAMCGVNLFSNLN